MSDKSKQEFEEFINSGECTDAVSALVTLVQHIFPGEIQKQGCSLLAASEYFRFKHGPKATSQH